MEHAASPSMSSKPRQAPSTGIARRRGVSLVEVMVAIVVLTIGVFILTSTITTAVAHSVVQQDRSLAIEAAGNMVEELRSMPFSELFALYNDDPADDPGGAGTAPGRVFDVEGLRPIFAEEGGVTVELPVGEVILPSRTRILREDVDLPQLGLPRDLDGDLVIDAADHARDYLVLPVIVRLRWMTSVGPRQYQMMTMFADLEKL